MPNPVLVKIAEDTLAAVQKGTFATPNGNTHTVDDLSKSNATQFYAPDSPLSSWAASSPTPDVASSETELVLRKNSTIEGVQYCAPSARKIGVLNFASATRPGGGFLTGARAQEESIARSSNLYSSLMTPEGQQFYAIHKSGTKSKYYTHAMIYTRDVQIFRSDAGGWVSPVRVDMLTSCAVNAGEVRRRQGGESSGRSGKNGIKAYFKPAAPAAPAAPAEDVEISIANVMRERMGRLLFLFEKEGTQDLVLGSFGTGVFRNNIDTVAKLWIELLVGPNARFKNSFRRVVFAIIDEKTCTIFREVLDSHKVDFSENGT
ncbi:hypothetical protein B0H15DRAFT_1018754 [Mycena belliarum]|uniref:Microbial-type PARG catalytic domain-containing protein n=1 Tax=Mycena belliarum TaxID=1033014 RepID=A0AAD6UGG2_9AGAR|nr:hypothetical protein B0H15DRAFT_1018754 [Mycena belliae]